MNRRTILVVAVVCVLAGAWIWRATRSEAALPVTTAAVQRAALLKSLVTASGEIVASQYAEIGSNVMGRLVSLTVKEGDQVTAGQVLAQIDPVQAASAADAAAASLAALEAEAKAAATQVRSATASLDEARSRASESAAALARAQQLKEAGLLPAAEFDRINATAAAADAQVAAAIASVERTQQSAGGTERRVAQGRAERARAADQLSKTSITAPISGVVTMLDVELGEMVVVGVQNQPGTTLMTVSDLSAIDAEVKVAEADVMRLSTGLPATITLEAVPGQRFSGRVLSIGASALPRAGAQVAAREFRVTVRLDAAAALRPGLTCDAEIVAAERHDVLAVPLQSVVERGGTTGVFRVADGVARFVPVKSGIIAGLEIEIDGLDEGTVIVSGPIQALRDLQDGSRVRADQGRR
jgi:HlyD family secretion protein